MSGKTGRNTLHKVLDKFLLYAIIIYVSRKDVMSAFGAGIIPEATCLSYDPPGLPGQTPGIRG